MTLKELKSLLRERKEKSLLLRLPDNGEVPVSFHITEVGEVRKNFMDCGGTKRTHTAAVLQVWVGSDEDHRLTCGKLVGILDKAQEVIPGDQLPVEIEYEDRVVSQYPVAGYLSNDDGLILNLSFKHTDCLAKEVCLPGNCGDNVGCCSSNEAVAPIKFQSVFKKAN